MEMPLMLLTLLVTGKLPYKVEVQAKITILLKFQVRLTSSHLKQEL